MVDSVDEYGPCGDSLSWRAVDSVGYQGVVLVAVADLAAARRPLEGLKNVLVTFRAI